MRPPIVTVPLSVTFSGRSLPLNPEEAVEIADRGGELQFDRVARDAAPLGGIEAGDLGIVEIIQLHPIDRRIGASA